MLNNRFKEKDATTPTYRASSGSDDFSGFFKHDWFKSGSQNEEFSNDYTMDDWVQPPANENIGDKAASNDYLYANKSSQNDDSDSYQNFLPEPTGITTPATEPETGQNHATVDPSKSDVIARPDTSPKNLLAKISAEVESEIGEATVDKPPSGRNKYLSFVYDKLGKGQFCLQFNELIGETTDSGNAEVFTKAHRHRVAMGFFPRFTSRLQLQGIPLNFQLSLIPA